MQAGNHIIGSSFSDWPTKILNCFNFRFFRENSTSEVSGFKPMQPSSFTDTAIEFQKRSPITVTVVAAQLQPQMRWPILLQAMKTQLSMMVRWMSGQKKICLSLKKSQIDLMRYLKGQVLGLLTFVFSPTREKAACLLALLWLLACLAVCLIPARYRFCAIYYGRVGKAKYPLQTFLLY